MNQAEWDEFAATYAAIQQESKLPIETDICAELARRYPLADWTVADLAAGSGRYARPLSQVARQVTLFDWSRQMLKEARTWLGPQSNITYQQADWRKLPAEPLADLVFVSQLPTLAASDLSRLSKLATAAVAINTQVAQFSQAQRVAAATLGWALPFVYQADPARAQGYQAALTAAAIPFTHKQFSYSLPTVTTVTEVLQSFERPFGLKQADAVAQALHQATPQTNFTTDTTYTYALIDWRV